MTRIARINTNLVTVEAFVGEIAAVKLKLCRPLFHFRFCPSFCRFGYNMAVKCAIGWGGRHSSFQQGKPLKRLNVRSRWEDTRLKRGC